MKVLISFSTSLCKEAEKGKNFKENTNFSRSLNKNQKENQKQTIPPNKQAKIMNRDNKTVLCCMFFRWGIKNYRASGEVLVIGGRSSSKVA